MIQTSQNFKDIFIMCTIMPWKVQNNWKWIPTANFFSMIIYFNMHVLTCPNMSFLLWHILKWMTFIWETYYKAFVSNIIVISKHESMSISFGYGNYSIITNFITSKLSFFQYLEGGGRGKSFFLICSFEGWGVGTSLLFFKIVEECVVHSFFVYGGWVQVHSFCFWRVEGWVQILFFFLFYLKGWGQGLNKGGGGQVELFGIWIVGGGEGEAYYSFF